MSTLEKGNNCIVVFKVQTNQNSYNFILIHSLLPLVTV